MAACVWLEQQLASSPSSIDTAAVRGISASGKVAAKCHSPGQSLCAFLWDASVLDSCIIPPSGRFRQYVRGSSPAGPKLAQIANIKSKKTSFAEKTLLDHPGIFDDPPPSDLDATPGERVELYDAGACTYLGTVCKSDMKVIIETFAEASDQEANDIFIIDESLALLSGSGVTQEFVTLLVDALKRRDYLLLRWMPE
ncbi:MAG: hypothetical protein ACTHK7_17150 [Aureliella sp.]